MVLKAVRVLVGAHDRHAQTEVARADARVEARKRSPSPAANRTVPFRALFCHSLNKLRDEFKTLDYQRIYDSMAKPAFVFDGRGVVDIEALRKIGFEVYCIGKSKPKYSLDSK